MLEIKDFITYEINECGMNIQKSLLKDDIFQTIFGLSNISQLPDYFKLQINFYYLEESLNIPIDDRFVVRKILLKEENFKRAFKKLLMSNNLESLSIFIDSKKYLSNNRINIEQPLLLIENDVKFPEMYITIKQYIKNKLDIFGKIFSQKITKKIKELKENKKFYSSECDLTLSIIKEKIKSDKELGLITEKIINFLNNYCNESIARKEEYANKLLENKKQLESLMKKTYEYDFRSSVIEKFPSLLENIKSSIKYDYIVNKLFGKLYSVSWNYLYKYNI